MIPRLHKRGTSFKVACRYILHDAGQDTSDRVLWAEGRNILSAPEDAWAEMFATARDQATLKQQAGKDARGRKNTKPVLHYTLSWAQTDNPSVEHMRETALASLKAMKLDQHQAVIAAHNDKEHLHVHIVANTIHPVTGLTAPLKFTKEALSRWAEAYEKEHGIHCQQRLRNNEERDKAREMSQAAALLSVGDCLQPGAERPTPYVPVKHRGQHRQRWYERQDVLDRMKRLRAEMDVGHKIVRNATWQRQKQERDELDRDCKAACHHARDHVERMYRPRWRDLYREQKREIRNLERDATHPFERAVYVFRNRERLGHGKALTFRQMFRLIVDQGKLLDRVDAVHDKERRALAQAEKAEKAVMTEPILVRHQARFDLLRSRQQAERSAEREGQFAKSQSITYAQAKASVRAEPFIHDTARSVFKRDQDMPTPSDRDPARAEEIKRHMDEWRKRNPDRDFGREM
jgi:hypothetical protein